MRMIYTDMFKSMKEKGSSIITEVSGINKTELNAQHKFDAMNTLEIFIVTYYFNAINGNFEKMWRIDKSMKKLLTIYKMPHPKTNVYPLDLLRTVWSRGSINTRTHTQKN